VNSSTPLQAGHSLTAFPNRFWVPLWTNSWFFALANLPPQNDAFDRRKGQGVPSTYRRETCQPKRSELQQPCARFLRFVTSVLGDIMLNIPTVSWLGEKIGSLHQYRQVRNTQTLLQRICLITALVVARPGQVSPEGPVGYRGDLLECVAARSNLQLSNSIVTLIMNWSARPHLHPGGSRRGRSTTCTGQPTH